MNTVNHTASIRHGLGHWLLASTAAASMALSMVSTAAFAADELPGKGVKVQPLKSSIAEESFQTQLVMKALEKLGYEVQPMKEVEYPTAHIALANGDAKGADANFADLSHTAPKAYRALAYMQQAGIALKRNDAPAAIALLDVSTPASYADTPYWSTKRCWIAAGSSGIPACTRSCAMCSAAIAISCTPNFLICKYKKNTSCFRK